MIKALTTVAASLVCSAPGAPDQTDQSRTVDAHFVADRVLVDVRLSDGRTMRMFTDTGGGGVLIYTAAATRLGLLTRPVPAGQDMPSGAAELTRPLVVAKGHVPELGGRILVMPDPFAGFDAPADADGMAGQSWFAGRTWTWDYPRSKLTIEAAGWQPVKGSRPLAVTFKGGGRGAGQRFPRVVVEIDGKETSMLFDTGATTVLTPEAAATMGGPRVRGTSMITASTIAGWRKAHPDWRVVENAQVRTGARMIEVPDVVIAGFQVGPVWFTERPDDNFRKFMSSMTDAPVEGALGGNALRTLRVTIDYEHSRGAVAQRSR